MIRIHKDRRTAAEHTYLRFNSGGSICLYEFAETCNHLFRILLGNQANADLRGCFGRDHRLGACAGEASGDAVHFKSRARPYFLEHRIARLTCEPRGADLLLEKLVFAERQALPTGFLRCRGRCHLVVDARDLNDTVGRS